MSIEDAAARLRSDPTFALDWALPALDMWLRYGCRCAYCGADMIANRDVAWFASTTDHLLPQGTYSEYANASWNWVLCCRACNSYKGTFDPSGGKGLEDARPEEVVVIWLEASKSYVVAKRRGLELAFARQKERLLEVMNSFGKVPLAASASVGSKLR